MGEFWTLIGFGLFFVLMMAAMTFPVWIIPALEEIKGIIKAFRKK